jgi:hypothetical protein
VVRAAREAGSGIAGVTSVVLVALAVIAGALALAAPAAATTITEGTLARPFTFSPLPATLELVDGADQALRLRTTATLLLGPDSPLMQSYPGPDDTADPRSVEVLPDGHLLVTDRERQVVAEITAGGALVWTYTHEDDAALVRPFSARRFVAGGRELTLIADRWAARVIAVDMSKRVVWQYGTTDEPGLGLDQLVDPFFAAYRDGRVLIADNNGGNRVLEIRYADYVEGAPDHGFTADSIVWQYGVAGEYGSAPGLLMKPRSPQRLDNGNVLICDADGQRVIEVRSSDYDADAPDLGYTADSIVWQFGVTAEPGSDDGHLSDPTYAERLSTGTTLIADTNNGRVLEVSRRGAIVRRWDLRTIGRPGTATATDTAEPRAATLGLDGSLVTADTAFGQILDIGVAGRAAAASTPLDGGRPATAKRWTRIALEASLPSTTGLVLDYSLDGQTWRTAALSDDLVAKLPDTTLGAALAYRVTLATGTLRLTPVVESVALEYQAVTVADDGATAAPVTTTAVPYDPDSTGAGTVVVDVGSTTPGSGTGTGSGSGDGAGDTGSGTAAETGGSATGGPIVTGDVGGDGTTAVSGYPLAAVGAGSAGTAAGVLIDADDAGAPPWPPLAALAVAAALVAVVVRHAEREHRRLATLDHGAARGSSPATAGASSSPAASRREVTA